MERSSIAENLAEVRSKMEAACAAASRSVDEVELVAVSKTWPSSVVREAYDAGQRVFGENKLQEMEEKGSALPDDCDWHFIGTAQRNKARKILAQAKFIHSVDSFKLAAAFDRIAKESGSVARVLLQINIGKEDSKSGFSVENLDSLSDDLVALENLEIGGLMAIPPAEDGRRHFSALRDLRDAIAPKMGLELSHLSMGMSGDYDVAIEEGSTIVRVGSSIFGRR